MYDVTDKESFEGLRFWLQEIDKFISVKLGMPLKESINLSLAISQIKWIKEKSPMMRDMNSQKLINWSLLKYLPLVLKISDKLSSCLQKK